MLKPKNGTPTWANYDPGSGAYYYVYGSSVATYKTASAIIILPTSMKLKGTGKGRNAYISLGVEAGAAGGIDIGIRNRGLDQGGDAGLGWEPYCLETHPDAGHFFNDTYKAPAGTKRAKIEVTPDLIEKNKVTLSVQWLDASNNVIDASTSLYSVIKLTKKFPWGVFFRFASLVSLDPTAPRNDSTYLLGGGFDSVKLGSANWGISTSLTTRAWIINEPKCSLPYGYWDTGEEFKIDHWA